MGNKKRERMTKKQGRKKERKKERGRLKKNEKRGHSAKIPKLMSPQKSP
jgi:hypothetical protein